MCFTQPDKCIEYTGPSAKDLGIEQGMKLSEFNAQVVSLLSQFKVALDKCKCSSSASIGKDADITLSNDTYKQYTLSNCINQINTKSFNYSVIKGDTIRFSYDISNFINSLPNGIVLETIRVRLTKNNTIIANLSGIASGITLNLSEVPVTAYFEARLGSTCGNIIASKSVYFTSEDISSTIDFEIQDSGSQQNVKTQEEFNQMIYNKLLKLQSTI